MLYRKKKKLSQLPSTPDKVRFKQYHCSTSPKYCLCFVHFFSDSQLQHSLPFDLQNCLVREMNSYLSPLVSQCYISTRKKDFNHHYKKFTISKCKQFRGFKKKKKKDTVKTQRRLKQHLKSAICLHKRLEAALCYL